jgi:NAD(P)-dependent dehydrogenase (short-subunit alcohol dehydrogenase family)
MRILITGGTNGMGKGVAKILASDDNKKHEIIILCRSESLGLTTIKELQSLSPHHRVSTILCDLMKLKDVKKVISQIHEQYDYLDGIFINAGIGYAEKRVVSEDGMVAHFQVNYLSQFMLTLNLLGLLEKSEMGGRVIFNATKGGTIHWDDLQLEEKWGYEEGIHQSMVAKRMFLSKLHRLYSKRDINLSFVGFEISKTVWTNQIQLIPFFMKAMATIMKFFGAFISIEACGEIIIPLLTESKEQTVQRSGKFITWKKEQFMDIEEEAFVLNPSEQDRLWEMSVDLCKDQKTAEIAKALHLD